MAAPTIREIIERLMNVHQPAPAPPGPGPQLDGYRLYKQEQQSMGDPVMSYAAWIAQQPPVGSH